MIVRCMSMARSKLGAELDLADAPRRAPRPARRRPRAVTGSACSQAGERTKAKRGGSGGSLAATAANGGRAIGRVSGSSSSKPASTSASSAASSTVRANTPTWSSVRDSSSAPLRGMRPWVGLKPTTPQNAAGRITEPLVCEPIAPGTMCGGDRRGRAARRAAGRALGIVRIAGLAGMEIGVLRGHGLAHDHGAGRAQPGDRGRVAPRRAAGPQRRAELGRHVAGVEDVLDADRHAVQRARAPCPACGARRRPRACRRACSRSRKAQAWIVASTSSMRVEAVADQLDRGDAALADIRGRLAEARVRTGSCVGDPRRIRTGAHRGV